ncbi:MAG: AbrB/MazE/SpoVT family DNA-binding domain-containing protein [Anaerolineales bacterium]
MTKITKISSKGTIVIPKEIRDAQGLQPGTQVAFVVYAGRVNLVPVPDDPVEASHGFLRDYGPLYPGPSVRQELLEEHQGEVEAETSSIPSQESHESICA